MTPRGQQALRLPALGVRPIQPRLHDFLELFELPRRHVLGSFEQRFGFPATLVQLSLGLLAGRLEFLGDLLLKLAELLLDGASFVLGPRNGMPALLGSRTGVCWTD